jgi:epoxyqueuosine reductase
MAYLERRLDERMSPDQYFEGAESILSFAQTYHTTWPQSEIKVASYAWGEDYHFTLKNRLEADMKALQETLGSFHYRICVDTSPLLEKTVAVQAGLGWQGKNSLVIHPQHGSTFFLAEVITTIPLEKFEQRENIRDHCGRCQRCIEACPTQALTPYILDAKKCISYWTLEHKGEFNETTPMWDDWVAGCDICQQVCPWNQKLITSEPESPLAHLNPEMMNSADFENWVQDSALSYVPAANWKRNLNHIQRKS